MRCSLTALIGALDFQRSATDYAPRAATKVSLEELVRSAERVQQGVPLSAKFDQFLFSGSSIGGAAPGGGQAFPPRDLQSESSVEKKVA